MEYALNVTEPAINAPLEIDQAAKDATTDSSSKALNAFQDASKANS
jgi:hypothetical protein